MARLQSVYAETARPELRRLPAVDILRRVWIQNFMTRDQQLIWRDNDNIPRFPTLAPREPGGCSGCGVSLVSS